MSTPLSEGEHEQLSVDGKQLGDGIFEAAAGLDRGANRVDPLHGHGLDVFLPVDHEGQ
jgi:hypothetical protein